MKKLIEKEEVNPKDAIKRALEVNHKKKYKERTEIEVIEHLWKSGGSLIFKNMEDFKIWLNSSEVDLKANIKNEDRSDVPINFIHSDVDKVKDLIGRLLHGVLA